MSADQPIIGGIIVSLTGAIGWLGKRLYDAPRPADVDALRKDRDDLRDVVLAATHEATRLALERDQENRKLRDEISELRISVERRVAAGDSHVLQRPTVQRPLRRPRRIGNRRDQTDSR